MNMWTLTATVWLYLAGAALFYHMMTNPVQHWLSRVVFTAAWPVLVLYLIWQEPRT